MKSQRRQSLVILKRAVANKQALEVVQLPFLLDIRKLNLVNSSLSIGCRGCFARRFEHKNELFPLWSFVYKQQHI